jgi:cell division septal protein FtsQ
MPDLYLTREAERPHHRAKGRFWLALVVLVGICLLAVYRSALFRLDELTLTGAHRLSEERVMEITGLAPGMARWERSAAAVEHLLRQEPWVKSVRAQWYWNKMHIAVLERYPVGVLQYHDLFYLVLDENGTILEQVELSERNGLPVISGTAPQSAVRGQRLHHAGLSDALTVISRFPAALRAQVSEVSIAPDRNLTLFMSGGTTVYWGHLPEGRNRIAEVDKKTAELDMTWHTVVKRRAGCEIDLQPVNSLTLSLSCN